MCELVIRVRDENGIDRPRRHARVIDLVSNHTQVAIAGSPRANPEEGERLAAQVDSEHAATRFDSGCDLHGEIAGTRTEVEDGQTRTKVEAFENLLGTLPRVPLALDLVEVGQRGACLLRDEEYGQRHEHGESNCRPFHRAAILTCAR